MDMTKFSATIASTDEYNKSINGFDYMKVGEGLKKKLEECLDIKTSIDGFLRDNFAWVLANARQYKHSYDDFYLGGDDIDYKDYNHDGNFDIIIHTTKDKEKNICHYKAFSIKNIHTDYRKLLSCGGYEYSECLLSDKIEKNSWQDRILNGDFSKITPQYAITWNEKLENDLRYWKKIVLPIFEIFLNHIKIRKERLLKGMNDIAGTKIEGRKVTITIEGL